MSKTHVFAIQKTSKGDVIRKSKSRKGDWPCQSSTNKEPKSIKENKSFPDWPLTMVSLLVTSHLKPNNQFSASQNFYSPYSAPIIIYNELIMAKRISISFPDNRNVNCSITIGFICIIYTDPGKGFCSDHFHKPVWLGDVHYHHGCGVYCEGAKRQI